MWDFFGLDAVVFNHAANDQAGMGPLYIEQAQTWFDSMWNSVSREYAP